MDPAKVIRHQLGTPDAYVIRDNGRRGEPLPGCDCMRCFGMCLVDPDVAHRETALRMEGGPADVEIPSELLP
jgi:hypothetical protein